MTDPYERERLLEEAAHERGEISSGELSRRLSEIDREEYNDARQGAEEAAEAEMTNCGFGRF